MPGGIGMMYPNNSQDNFPSMWCSPCIRHRRKSCWMDRLTNMGYGLKGAHGIVKA